jgi:hypothetical protein
MDNDEFMTVREAAQFLGRGTARVRQHIKEGRLTPHWSHGILWVRRTEVEKIPSLVRKYSKQESPRGKRRRRTARGAGTG